MVLIEVFAVFHFFSMDFFQFRKQIPQFIYLYFRTEKNIFQMLRVHVAHKPSGSQELQLARACVDKPQVFLLLLHISYVMWKGKQDVNQFPERNLKV